MPLTFLLTHLLGRSASRVVGGCSWPLHHGTQRQRASVFTFRRSCRAPERLFTEVREKIMSRDYKTSTIDCRFHQFSVPLFDPTDFPIKSLCSSLPRRPNPHSHLPSGDLNGSLDRVLHWFHPKTLIVITRFHYLTHVMMHRNNSGSRPPPEGTPPTCVSVPWTF